MPTSINKRIAKNTIFLYIRMIIVMGVTLYTSRIVLNVLGFDEYGLYNLVAGIVVLFSFLNGSMTTTSQRYLCVGIGKEDISYQQLVFRSSIKLHLAVSVLFFIIAEPIGLWMIHHVLKIPRELLSTSNIVYQLGIITAIFNIIKVPFNAAIIAHERMDFYAISSIIEATLKLIILIPLIYIKGSKVVIYSGLVVFVQLIIFLWYFSYCKRNFNGLFTTPRESQKHILLEMLRFTGWSNFSSISNIGAKQGLGIISNMFIGVLVNAAIGIMNQVTTAVYTFITNFQMAINPPLIKYYTNTNSIELRKLFNLSAKFSFYLMLALSIPVIFYIHEILNVWLKDVPPFTASLCVCALISLLPNVLGGPVWTLIQATGRIRKYQITISCFILSNLPVDWILLSLGFQPYTLLLYSTICNISVVIAGIVFLCQWKILVFKSICKEICLPILIVTLLSVITGFGITSLLPQRSLDILQLMTNIGVLFICVVVCSALAGTTSGERGMLINLIRHKIS